jgi:hypothetical protein
MKILFSDKNRYKIDVFRKKQRSHVMRIIQHR